MTAGAKRGTIFYGAMAFVQAALWGAGNVVTKTAYLYITPFWCLTVRFGIAALMFFLFFNRRIRENLSSIKLGPALLVGLTTAAAYGFAYQALALSDATTAGFLMAISVIFVPLIARLLQKTAVDLKILPVIPVVIAGMYLLCGGGKFSVGLGEIFAVCSSMSYAFSLVFSARFLRHTEPISLTFVQCLTAAAVFIPMALVLEPLPAVSAFTGEAVWTLLFLSVGCSFFCYLFQNLILSNLSSTLTSLILCSESVFTALIAGILLGERLDTAGYIGAALIMAGVVFATWISREKPKPAEG